MMNYPYNKPGVANPYGAHGAFPGHSVVSPSGYPGMGSPGMGSPGMGSPATGPQGGAGSYPAGPGAPMGAPGSMGTTGGVPVSPGGAGQSQLPLEQSYIENILRLNLGKIGTFYMTYENNREWNAKIFKGRIEAAGRDHIIISDPQTGMRFLLLMVNLDYVTFDEELNYFYAPQTVGGAPASR